MRCVKLLYLNRINAKNAIWCTSDLMSETETVGAGDTSKLNPFLLCVQISLQKICKRMSLGRKNDCKRKTTVEDNLGVNNEKLT